MVCAVTFLFVVTCFLNFNVEASCVKSNDFLSDFVLNYDKELSNHKFKENNEIEWFDGSFKGVWGKTNDYSDGEFKGNLNFGRTSSDGKFFCELNDYDGSIYTVKGFFKNNFLTGFIKSDEKIIPKLFFGKISIYDTNFTAVIFIFKTGILYVKGEYDGSFLPPLTGPYGIGVKNLHLIDESRPEYFTKSNPDDFREMMIQISYPIDKEINTPSVEYMDDPTFAWLKDRSPIPLFTIPNDAYTFVNPHGILSSSISENKDMYPVIIFSPGYDGVYQIYTSLIEDIVGNGFIVVSINHPYISGITVFPDGRKVYVSRNSTGDLGIRSVVEDAKFVLDKITELNNTDPILRGKFDLSKVGMYGHSFGGASTSICCYEDDRFLCGLTLDGVFYLDYIPDGLDKPFLLLIAEDRFNDKNVQDLWNNLYGDSYKVEILGSTHYAYTDVGVLLNHLVPLIPNKILGFGTIEPKRHVNITRNFELAFFNVYLKDRPIHELIDLGSYFEEVNFEFK
jgi:hypothetical protein